LAFCWNRFRRARGHAAPSTEHTGYGDQDRHIMTIIVTVIAPYRRKDAAVGRWFSTVHRRAWHKPNSASHSPLRRFDHELPTLPEQLAAVSQPDRFPLYPINLPSGRVARCTQIPIAPACGTVVSSPPAVSPIEDGRRLPAGVIGATIIGSHQAIFNMNGSPDR
jgi:hypothetical protein